MGPMRSAHREVEAKLLVRDAGEAAAVLRALGVPPGRAGREVPVRDVYYDTGRRDLLAAGYAFRVRAVAAGHREATLKSFAAPEGGGIADREERTVALATDRPSVDRLPPGVLRDLLTRATQGRPLVPLARISGRRRSFARRPRPGLVVAVSHDRVRGACGRGRVEIQEIEAELREGSRADFVAWLTAALAGTDARRGGASKLERALRTGRVRLPSPARMAAARLALRPPAGPSAPAGEALAGTLGRLGAWLGRAMDAARRGSVEGVHDVRTVSRRLRAVLAAHRDEVPDRARREVREALDDLRRAAGPVRDLDVLRETIDGVRFDAADAHGAAALRAVLAARRRPLRRHLHAALASPRLARLPDRIGALAAEALGHPSAPFAIAAAARLPASLERALTRLAAVPRPAGDARPEDLHAFRIAVKRARYAAEAFAPAFGKPVDRFRTALTALQDALGGLQDAHVIGASLEPLVAEAGRQGARGEAAARAAAAVAAALSAHALALRRDLDARIEAALGRDALRDLHAHVAKRAGDVVADARR